jgi:gliding motility-associated-like protein
MIKKLKGRKIILILPFFIFHFSPDNYRIFISNSFGQPLTAHAGSNTSVCLNDSVQIGGNPSATGGKPPYTYSWTPAATLNVSSAANPYAFPSSTTPYTLTVTDSTGSTAVSAITVSVLPLPIVIAGPDQTIIGGTSTQLQASGAVNYFWSPVTNLSSQNSATPTADPGASITYCVAGVDAKGCVSFDCTEIAVIPSDTVIIYNAFTPNGDGANDVLYIGNIQRFPNNTIQVFNRNGKLVFQESPYKNSWSGKIDGEELPSATYYVVFDKGDGAGKAHGAVTIIR